MGERHGCCGTKACKGPPHLDLHVDKMVFRENTPLVVRDYILGAVSNVDDLDDHAKTLTETPKSCVWGNENLASPPITMLNAGQSLFY